MNIPNDVHSERALSNLSGLPAAPAFWYLEPRLLRYAPIPSRHPRLVGLSTEPSRLNSAVHSVPGSATSPLAEPSRILHLKKWENPFGVKSWQGARQFEFAGTVVLKLECDNRSEP
jgi:hypothetical protein